MRRRNWTCRATESVRLREAIIRFGRRAFGIPAPFLRCPRHRRLLTAVFLSLLSMRAFGAEPVARSDSPPRSFVLTWQDAIGSTRSGRDEARRLLAATGEWEPFFRAAYNGTT